MHFSLPCGPHDLVRVSSLLALLKLNGFQFAFYYDDEGRLDLEFQSEPKEILDCLMTSWILDRDPHQL
jgi:hypothetical protein